MSVAFLYIYLNHVFLRISYHNHLKKYSILRIKGIHFSLDLISPLFKLYIFRIESVFYSPDEKNEVEKDRMIKQAVDLY